jgi:hypothetical protein
VKVVATAPDGTIEGLEDPSFPLMAAMQWHPERLTTEPEHLAPVKLLVEKAAGKSWTAKDLCAKCYVLLRNVTKNGANFFVGWIVEVKRIPLDSYSCQIEIVRFFRPADGWPLWC